jgi:hypothetical protein
MNIRVAMSTHILIVMNTIIMITCTQMAMTIITATAQHAHMLRE